MRGLKYPHRLSIALLDLVSIGWVRDVALGSGKEEEGVSSQGVPLLSKARMIGYTLDGIEHVDQDRRVRRRRLPDLVEGYVENAGIGRNPAMEAGNALMIAHRLMK